VIPRGAGRARGRGTGEQGETLIELLVTVVIMGTSIIAILLGVATAVASSDTHRQEATGEGVVRSYAEAVLAAPYVDCATTYAPVGYTAPSGWTVTIGPIGYLQKANTTYATGVANCPSPDQGAQQFTVTAVSPHVKHGTTETITAVKRRR
jgi:type II secretory pathway pseudopilin PulG